MNLAIVLRNDRCIGGCVTSHTTRVESTKCKLCTRLTNSLGCNNAHCLTELYHALCGKVAAVTLHADSLLALAGEYRTYLDALDRRVFDGLGNWLGDFLAGMYKHLTCRRMDDIVYRYTAEDALRE